jgi:hypothetical protein
MGRLLCWIGLHKWKLSSGLGCTRGGSRMAIFYDKDCRRCGKHKNAVMVL